MIRTLVQRGTPLTIPCWRHNEPSVRAMFTDLGEAVEVVSIDTERELISMPGPSIDLGYYGERFYAALWDASFYRQAGVPFLAKWEAFHIPLFPMVRAEALPFIHDDAARGFVISMEGYRPLRRTTIFDHFYELVVAPEIHCINSCFAILADLINAPGEKFLHKYARADGGVLPIFGRQWTILEQPL